jgi:hypothetical protein
MGEVRILKRDANPEWRRNGSETGCEGSGERHFHALKRYVKYWY